MKKFIILLMSQLPGLLPAQDTLISFQGDTTFAKISALENGEIKFRRSDNPQGPDYVLYRKDISLICLSSGVRMINEMPVIRKLPPKPVIDNTIYETKDDAIYLAEGKKLSERRVHKQLMETGDPEIIGLVRKSKLGHLQQPVGFLMIPSGLGLLASLLDNGNNPGLRMAVLPSCLIVGITSGVISYRGKEKRYENTKKAVRLYNERY